MSDPDKPATAPGAPALEDSLPEPVRWIKENFEAVVVAFIMALVIRCFCLEVFKIPTASMEPTLLGDARDHSRGGDRIMVNKLAYEFGSVSRYDVLVFKFPLDLSRNFIKRAVGLPDEDFCFRGGDIYTRRGFGEPYVLARKPVRVQENVWIPVYTDGLEGRAFRTRWGHATEEKDNWEVYQGALRTYTGPGKSPETRFEFNPSDTTICDVDPDRAGDHSSPHPMSDLRLAARVEFLGPRGEFHLMLRLGERTPRERTFRVLLRPGAPVRIEHPDKDDGRAAAPAAAPAVVELAEIVRPETEYRVALLVYDGSVAVLLNGRLVHEHVYRTALPPDGDAAPSVHLGFGTRDAEVLVRDVAVARDLHYFMAGESGASFTPERPVHIPSDSFLLVGDNIRNSHDGRAWQRVEVEFTDGGRVYWDRGLFVLEPKESVLGQVPPDSAIFYKKGDANPHANEIGWVVPHRRIKSVGYPVPRVEIRLRSGEVVQCDESLVERVPGGFLLRRGEPAPGAPPPPGRTLDEQEVVNIRRMAEVELTWVERRHVVGKAFAIWWPMGRWFRLIR
jgi:signal peptidase I